MKAKLSSGAIVVLEKDCDCITHDGPHWLHMDQLWRIRNQQLLDADALDAFTHAEIERLDEKLANMLRLGIDEILRDS